jgi:hypothetical protein
MVEWKSTKRGGLTPEASWDASGVGTAVTARFSVIEELLLCISSSQILNRVGADLHPDYSLEIRCEPALHDGPERSRRENE